MFLQLSNFLAKTSIEQLCSSSIMLQKWLKYHQDSPQLQEVSDQITGDGALWKSKNHSEPKKPQHPKVCARCRNVEDSSLPLFSGSHSHHHYCLTKGVTWGYSPNVSCELKATCKRAGCEPSTTELLAPSLCRRQPPFDWVRGSRKTNCLPYWPHSWWPVWGISTAQSAFSSAETEKEPGLPSLLRHHPLTVWDRALNWISKSTQAKNTPFCYLVFLFHKKMLALPQRTRNAELCFECLP